MIKDLFHFEELMATPEVNGNPAYSFCSFLKVGTSKKHMAMRRGASNNK
jgi:hypothetical protein